MSTLLNIIFITILGLTFVSARIEKRGDRCVGCPSDADVNDPELKNYLTAIMVAKNNPGDVIKVIKATKQVVAGIKYSVEFEAMVSDQSKICDTTFVHQPWMSTKFNIIDFICREK